MPSWPSKLLPPAGATHSHSLILPTRTTTAQLLNRAASPGKAFPPEASVPSVDSISPAFHARTNLLLRASAGSCPDQAASSQNASKAVFPRLEVAVHPRSLVANNRNSLSLRCRSRRRMTHLLTSTSPCPMAQLAHILRTAPLQALLLATTSAVVPSL